MKGERSKDVAVYRKAMANFYQERIRSLEATKRGIEMKWGSDKQRNPFNHEWIRLGAQIETLRGVTDDLYFQLAR